ncbi:hypothetical protein GCM10009547_36610 [Sporichthya brevicatena]|uniref:Uncharacterized protein n=1 Tax=Sporichthya brevicatena TaxID=171442 RepID=A0ABP3S9F8_9ACTN
MGKRAPTRARRGPAAGAGGPVRSAGEEERGRLLLGRLVLLHDLHQHVERDRRESAALDVGDDRRPLVRVGTQIAANDLTWLTPGV